MRNTAMLSPPFGGLKSVRFGEKSASIPLGYPAGGKPMGGGLSADCGQKNMGFSTPLRTVFSMKKRHGFWPMACKNVYAKRFG